MCKQVFHQYAFCKHKANVRFEICIITASERGGRPSPFPCDVDLWYEPQTNWPAKCPACREKDSLENEERKWQEALDKISHASKRPGPWIPGLGNGKKTDGEYAAEEKDKETEPQSPESVKVGREWLAPLTFILG